MRQFEMQRREAKIMRKYFILPLVLVFALAVGLSAPLANAQTTGSVKGTCRDSEGKPIAQAEVVWTGTETGRVYTLKTNNKGEYFSLGITPGKYNVKLSKDGKELFHINGLPVGLDETDQDIDLKKEQATQALSQGMTPEQLKAKQEEAAKAAAETKTVGTLNDKLKAASAASAAGDYDTAIATLTEANQIDPSRDQIWALLGDAYRTSAPKQSDSAAKQERYEKAVTDYQKAIELRSAAPNPEKDGNRNKDLAAYYNNLADAYSKSGKVDDAVANYTKAAQLDPTHAGSYLFNVGAVLTNAGKVDDAIAAFDKVIAADPTKASAYYWKGVNLIGKETIGKDGKVVAADGTAEAFRKYLELDPSGPYAQPAKDMLASIGVTVETGFGKKAPVKK
jgi:tetratricopeptide (TPR) repeat protein